MLITPRQDNLNKIVILNPKGGCGKSTLATNLAACYASRGTTPAIMDYDPQGSSMAWLERRPDERDRRRTLVWLSDTGLHTWRESRRVLAHERLESALDQLDPARRVALLEGLQALLDQPLTRGERE